MTYLILNEALIDWVTLTTFDNRVALAWREWLLEAGINPATLPSTRWENYRGIQATLPDGSVFWGSGRQAGRDHSAMWVSSVLADSVGIDLYQIWDSEEEWSKRAKCTRVDLQITIIQPEGWNQWEFAERVRKTGRTVNTSSSRDKQGRETATIYVNAFKSDNLMRVYQKIADTGTYLLRCEMMIKNGRSPGRANEYMKLLHDSKHANTHKANMKATLLLDHIQTIGDQQLEEIFIPYLIGYQVRGATKIKYSEPNKRRDWIIKSVIPALAKHFSEYPGDDLVIDIAKSCGMEVTAREKQ